MAMHTCNPGYLGDGDRRMAIQGWPGQKQKSTRPYLKNKLKAKKDWCGSSGWVEHLPSKWEALNSIPSTTKIIITMMMKF
jgi:hypothetical protein